MNKIIKLSFAEYRTYRSACADRGISFLDYDVDKKTDAQFGFKFNNHISFGEIEITDKEKYLFFLLKYN